MLRINCRINMLALIHTPNMRKDTPNMRGKFGDVHQICVNRYTKYAWKTARLNSALWIVIMGTVQFLVKCLTIQNSKSGSESDRLAVQKNW